MDVILRAPSYSMTYFFNLRTSLKLSIRTSSIQLSKSGSKVPLPNPHCSNSPEHLAGVISLNSERSIKLIIKKLYTNWARAHTMDPNLVESLPKDSHNGLYNGYPTVFTPFFVTLRVAGHCFCQIGMLKKDSMNKLNTYWQFPKLFF
jgi:hypothetical protein